MLIRTGGTVEITAIKLRKDCHPRAGGGSISPMAPSPSWGWIPACAGMTRSLNLMAVTVELILRYIPIQPEDTGFSLSLFVLSKRLKTRNRLAIIRF